MKCLLIAPVLILLHVGLFSQKNVDLKLKHTGNDGEVSCFDILLRAPDGQGIDLAGQNYRIFYDALNVEFLRDRISHNLDKDAYSKLDIIQTSNHNIGFVSISTDGRILSDKGIHLPRNGTWVKTMNICFSHAEDQPLDLTWANRKKTASFATAEVAMSEWEHAERQQILLPNELYDFSSLDQEASLADEIVINVYPNPIVNHINLAFSHQIQGSVFVKDIIGRQIVRERLNGTMELQYNLGSWPEGTYTVMVLDDEGSLLKSQRIVKINP